MNAEARKCCGRVIVDVEGQKRKRVAGSMGRCEKSRQRGKSEERQNKHC
jgi:hypothetical protein